MSTWPFTRPALVARETTTRLLTPPVGWIIRGPTVVGREHLDDLSGGFLMCPNHASHFDSSSLRIALGPRLRRRLAIAAAADYWWRNRVPAFLASWLGSFPFNRQGAGGAESIKAIERMLDDGWGILIYPEGTRSRSGEIGTFKPGAGLIAVRTGCPVVPVRILGTHDVLPPGARLPHRSRVQVRFGKPIRAQPGEDARQFTQRLEDAVRAL